MANYGVFNLVSIFVLGKRRLWCTSDTITYKGETWERYEMSTPVVTQGANAGVKTASLVLPNTGYKLGAAIVTQGLGAVFTRDRPVEIYDCTSVALGVVDTAALVFSGFVDKCAGIDEWIKISCVDYDPKANFFPKQMVNDRDFDFLVVDGTVFHWNGENVTFEEQSNG